MRPPAARDLQPPAAPAQTAAATPTRHPLQRAALIVLAVASLCVAAVGVVLPGLPSTEFVLLAAWAAARSSPRLHRWLMQHRWFGPALANWNNGRRVSRRSKWGATVSMTLCALLMAKTVPHLQSVAICVGIMGLVLLWLWSRPEP